MPLPPEVAKAKTRLPSSRDLTQLLKLVRPRRGALDRQRRLRAALRQDTRGALHAVAGNEGLFLGTGDAPGEGFRQEPLDIHSGVLRQRVRHLDHHAQLVLLQGAGVEGRVHDVDGLALGKPLGLWRVRYDWDVRFHALGVDHGGEPAHDVLALQGADDVLLQDVRAARRLNPLD